MRSFKNLYDTFLKKCPYIAENRGGIIQRHIGGLAEIENVKKNSDLWIFNFSSSMRGHFSNVTPLFCLRNVDEKNVMIQIFERCI